MNIAMLVFVNTALDLIHHGVFIAVGPFIYILGITTVIKIISISAVIARVGLAVAVVLVVVLAVRPVLS